MFKFFSILFLSVILFSVHAKTYTMVVEPIYPAYQTTAIYQPFQQWLKNKTGYDVEIIVDISYGIYWKKAKGTRMPDFSLDASHIASFRQLEKNYQPLVTTFEPLSFHLVSSQSPDLNQTIQQQLMGKKVVMLPKPSYANQVFNLWFTDLFASPYKDVTSLSWQDSVDAIFDGTVDAAIVPDWMLNLYPNLTSMMQSQELPGPTFMVSPNVPENVSQKIKSALLDLANDEESYNV